MNKMKMTATLMTILFLASITVIAIPVSAQTTEVWVDDNWSGSSPGDPVDGHTFGTDAFATIQDGINAVDEDGTVNVAAGTYPEVVTIDKSLTLLGAKAGVDARTRDTSSGESILDGTTVVFPDIGLGAFNIEDGVTDVIIDGFEICNYPGSFNPGDGSAVMAYCYGMGAVGRSGITIRNNYMHDLGWNGILVWSYNGEVQEDFTIQFNLIEEAPYAGIELTNVIDSQVLDNKIVAPTSIVDDPGDAGVGIEIAVRAWAGQDITAGTGVLVEGNEITGAFPMGPSTGISRAGINLLSRAYASDSIAILSGVTVRDNAVSGGGEYLRAGILVVAQVKTPGGSALATDISVEDNTLDGNTVGLEVEDITGGTCGSVTVTGNQFQDNPIHVLDEAEVLDITQVLENNIFDRAVVIDRPGGPGSFLHVIYSSIQDAIDNAQGGDTINVAAGTYDEYTDISKSITLSGQSGAIVKPLTGEGNIIIAINADDVTVKGFEVDGTELSYAWAGIGSWTGCTGVTIKENIVHGIRNKLPDDIYGLGIGLWRGDNNIYDGILIEGNVIYDTDRMGIYIGARIAWDQNYLLSVSNIIKDNVVHDTMINAAEAFPVGCGGITMDAAKDCTIEGNIVYNTGTTSNQMPGIFLAHGSATGNQISGNDVYSQAYGIAIEINRGDVNFDGVSKAAPKVHYNNIHDNGEYGLIVLNAAGKTVDATLNWWGHASGPSGPGGRKNPAGKTIGKGDSVSENVDWDPWLRRRVWTNPAGKQLPP